MCPTRATRSADYTSASLLALSPDTAKRGEFFRLLENNDLRLSDADLKDIFSKMSKNNRGNDVNWIARSIDRVIRSPLIRYQVLRKIIQDAHGRDELYNLIDTIGEKLPCLSNDDQRSFLMIELAKCSHFEEINEILVRNRLTQHINDNHALAFAKSCCIHCNSAEKYFDSNYPQALSAEAKNDLLDHCVDNREIAEHFHQNLENFEIKKAKKKAILRKVAKKCPTALAGYMRTCGDALDLDERNDYFIQAIKAEPAAAWSHQAFNLDDEQIIEGYLQAIQVDPDVMLNYKSNDPLTSEQWSTVTRRSIQTCIENQDFNTLVQILEKGFDSSDVEKKDERFEYLINFLKANEFIPDSSNLLDAPTNTPALRMNAITAICLANKDLPQENQAMPLSRLAIQKLSAIPDSFFEKVSSGSAHLRMLYANTYEELAHQLEGESDIEFVEPYPAKLSETNQLLALRSAERSLAKAVGIRVEKVSIGRDNFTEINQRLESNCVDLLGRIFQTSFENDTDVSRYTESIKVIATLASRFTHEQDGEWKPCLEELKAITTDLLSGKYIEQKYSSRRQLRLLAKNDKVDEWKRNAYSLKVIKPEESSADEKLERFQATLNRINTRNSSKDVEDNVPDTDLEIIENDRLFYKKIKDLPSQEAVAYCAKVAKHFVEQKDLISLRKLSARIASNQVVMLKDFGDSQKQATIHDLAYLKEISKTKKPAAYQKEYLSLAMITDDLFTMLTVGERTGVVSCQSHLTGTHADCVLANAIDANIKVGLNFMLPLSELGEIGKAYIVDPQSINVEIDEEAQILKLSKDKESIEVSLNQALSRRIMRLGEIDDEEAKEIKGATIAPEQSYHQQHIAYEQGDSHLIDLMHEKIREIGGIIPEEDQEVHIVGTEYEGGVYSDAAGEVVFHDFVMAYSTAT